MASVKDVFEFIDSIAPFDTQQQWDNSGFLVGDIDKIVKKIGVVLDITPETIDLAAMHEVDLIVSHHPVIFKPQKSFTKNNAAYQLAVKGINAICAHTSLDSADGGVNDVLSQLLGLRRVEPFYADENETPLLRVGFVNEMNAKTLAKTVANALGHENYAVKYCDGGKPIETVAVCGGAGDSFIEDIVQADIDAYVTGEAGYHDMLYACESGLTLIVAGHFETENPIVRVLAQKLDLQFEDIQTVIIPQKPSIKYLTVE